MKRLICRLVGHQPAPSRIIKRAYVTLTEWRCLRCGQPLDADDPSVELQTGILRQFGR